MLRLGGMLLGLAAAVHGRRSEVWSRDETEAHGIVWRGNHTTSPLPHEYLQDADVPAEFTWCNKSGVNYCTINRNQHIPQYCGSCWAHGAISAISDRIKIARKAKGPDVNVAVQHMLNCGNAGSCHGGSVDGPYQWMHNKPVAYETENPYLACSSESKEGLCPHIDTSCKSVNVARTCGTDGNCVGLSRFPNVTVSEYGSIRGASAMQKEIYARGPISCGICGQCIEKYTGGIATGMGFTDHVISVVGWGQSDSSENYWIVRNSWGEAWGEMGYVRVKFGALDVESQCSWAVPGSYSDGEAFGCGIDGTGCTKGVASPSPTPQTRRSELWTRAETESAGIVWRGNQTQSPLPHEYLKTEDLPTEMNWCDYKGINYCTINRNQHIPQYCGSCWAHAAVSALGDRIKIARSKTQQGHPGVPMGIDIDLSVQHLLNCGGVGSCHGGSLDGAYQWIAEHTNKTGWGIGYESLKPYFACSSDSTNGFCPHGNWSCSAINRAMTCPTFGEKCRALHQYPNATVTEYGSISGADAMKKEIAARGPIVCGVDSGPIDDYTGGIVTAKGSSMNHAISVVGWGNDATAGDYWIVRNSWGEYWGEFGFFRAAVGSLLIETQCTWAVPGAFTEVNYPCYEDGTNCKTAPPHKQ